MKKITLIATFMTFLVVMLPICFADSISLSYDKNGNLITGDGLFRVYNTLNQLYKIYNGSDTNGNLLEEYTYHPTEERVLIKKTYDTSGDVVESVYYVSDELVRVINTSGSFDFVYVKHGGQRVAELRSDSSKVFVHSDHLGSTSLVTDESGVAVDNVSYSPFGLIISGDNVSRYSYEGQEYDDTIGQYDFHFRGYKAEWGKFVQPDSLLPNVYDPQQLNRYAFERNNPWNNVDPTGHKQGGPWLNIPSAAYTVKKGFSLSFRYFKIANIALKHGKFKSSMRLYGKSIGKASETFVRATSVLGAGGGDPSEGMKISFLITPDLKEDFSLIDKEYEEEEEEFDNEWKKLKKEIENSTEESNPAITSGNDGKGATRGGGGGGGGSGYRETPDGRRVCPTCDDDGYDQGTGYTPPGDNNDNSDD